MNSLSRFEHDAQLQGGSRTEVPLGCGNVCAQAVFAGIDRKTRRPWYAVRIANNSERELHARVTSGVCALESDLVIAPFSITDTLVSVRRREDRAVVAVRGGGVHFSIDAKPLPEKVHSHTRFAWTFAAFCFGIVLVLSALLYTHLVQRAASVAAVPHPVRTAQPRTIVKTVRERPLLDDLDVLSAVVAGSPLRVRYGASAAGMLYLLDEQGRVWAQRSLDPSGESTIDVPASAAGKTLRVVASARRGAQRAQLAASVIVLPNGADGAPDDSKVERSETVSDRVRSGDAIRIRFLHRQPDTTVAVTDAAGNIMQSIDVSSTERTVTLRAPAVAAPAVYDVVVTAARGRATETRVHAV
ncbi:MAG TPA: hypothetical protein VFN49_06760, partial [Candidatus Aquilonibacter sp.]|nr:hypothetical protein [Candidatus Aquilonibacter sp.]